MDADFTQKQIARFFRKVEKTSTCWNWIAAVDRWGYGRFKCQYVAWGAHRWSYTYHKGPIPPGLVIRHSCDNPRCVNPAHMKVGTIRENNEDTFRRGRHPGTRYLTTVGYQYPAAKLTWAHAAEIRRPYSEGHTIRQLAARFPVKGESIRKVIKGASWLPSLSPKEQKGE